MMPRKRTIDDEPDRYCENEECKTPGKLIPKQKPGGKWKTPLQYRRQKGCCVPCSKTLRLKTSAAKATVKKTGRVEVILDDMALFLQQKI